MFVLIFTSLHNIQHNLGVRLSFILFAQILEVYSVLTGQTDFNVTLPMILAEWQKLVNSSLQFKELLERVTTELDGEYWMNWMPDNSTLNANESLLQRS